MPHKQIGKFVKGKLSNLKKNYQERKAYNAETKKEAIKAYREEYQKHRIEGAREKARRDAANRSKGMFTGFAKRLEGASKTADTASDLFFGKSSGKKKKKGKKTKKDDMFSGLI